ncbi:Na+/glutamate symporter [Staphylococcus hominis]
MALGVIQWILVIAIIIITIGVIFGLIWGSLFEERFYKNRSKKEEEERIEKNLEMAKGHTDDDVVYDEEGRASLKNEYKNHK